MLISIRNSVTQELRTDGRFIAVSCAEDNLQSDLELGGINSHSRRAISVKKRSADSV